MLPPKNHKTDKLYVNRDEVVGNLRGTTRIEPAVMRSITLKRGGTWYWVPLGLSANGDDPALSTSYVATYFQQPALGWTSSDGSTKGLAAGGPFSLRVPYLSTLPIIAFPCAYCYKV